MKKRLFLLSFLLLAACTAKTPSSSVANTSSRDEPSTSETSSSEEEISSTPQESSSSSSIEQEEKELILNPSDMSYEEVVDVLNPERGFYHQLSMDLKQSGGSKRGDLSDAKLNNVSIAHLRFNLKDFSKNAGGTDSDISQAALNYVDNIIKELKAKNIAIILRLSYNLDGTKSGSNYLNAEPSLDLIKRHIEQIAPILNANKEAIVTLESGMIGPWGEQHSTTMAQDRSNIVAVVDKWLETLDEEIKINVRRPLYFVDWMNAHGYPECSVYNLSSYDYSSIPNAYRIGLFNDGYLGSSDDLGTYIDRDSEVNWLLNHASKTLFGGEAETAIPVSQNEYCSSEFMIEEAFKTHTSYLNIEYNTNILNAWKNETYHGNDEAFKNKSGFDYITNHMGYRFLINDCKLTTEMNDASKGKVEFVIENKGFGNVIRDKIVQLLFVKDNKVETISLPLDIQEVESLTQTKVAIDFTLDSSLEDGNYNLYLKITQDGENYLPIKLANKDSFNSTYNANYLGKITLKNDKKNISSASVSTLKSSSPLMVKGNNVVKRSSSIVLGEVKKEGDYISLNPTSSIADITLNKGSYAASQFIDIPVSNYDDSYTNLTLTFEATHQMTLSLYVGWDDAITWQKTYNAGLNKIEMNIATSDAYLKQMKGKKSFDFRIFIQHGKTVNETQNLKIEDFSLYNAQVNEKHTITYKSNEALGVMYSSTFNKGDVVQLLENYFVLENKQFACWVDQNNKTYTSLQNVTLNEDLVLTPRFN